MRRFCCYCSACAVRRWVKCNCAFFLNIQDFPHPPLYWIHLPPFPIYPPGRWCKPSSTFQAYVFPRPCNVITFPVTDALIRCRIWGWKSPFGFPQPLPRRPPCSAEKLVALCLRFFACGLSPSLETVTSSFSPLMCWNFATACLGLGHFFSFSLGKKTLFF